MSSSRSRRRFGRRACYRCAGQVRLCRIDQQPMISDSCATKNNVVLHFLPVCKRHFYLPLPPAQHERCFYHMADLCNAAGIPDFAPADNLRAMAD